MMLSRYGGNPSCLGAVQCCSSAKVTFNDSFIKEGDDV